jgi:hypothetical protein
MAKKQVLWQKKMPARRHVQTPKGVAVIQENAVDYQPEVDNTFPTQPETMKQKETG